MRFRGGVAIEVRRPPSVEDMSKILDQDKDDMSLKPVSEGKRMSMDAVRPSPWNTMEDGMNRNDPPRRSRPTTRERSAWGTARGTAREATRRPGAGAGTAGRSCPSRISTACAPSTSSSRRATAAAASRSPTSSSA